MKNMTILAIDDNAVNLAAIKHALEDDYKVIPMNNGQRALRYLDSKKADFILLDVRMPDMDGIGTLNEIRKLENGKNVPVIFLSAAKDEEAIAEGFRLGISDYITKPFHGEDLKARIEACRIGRPGTKKNHP